MYVGTEGQAEKEKTRKLEVDAKRKVSPERMISGATIGRRARVVSAASWEPVLKYSNASLN